MDSSVSIEVWCNGESSTGIQVRKLGSTDDVWVPREQIDASSAVQHQNDSGALVIPQALAEQLGLA